MAVHFTEKRSNATVAFATVLARISSHLSHFGPGQQWPRAPLSSYDGQFQGSRFKVCVCVSVQWYCACGVVKGQHAPGGGGTPSLPLKTINTLPSSTDKQVSHLNTMILPGGNSLNTTSCVFPPPVFR